MCSTRIRWWWPTTCWCGCTCRSATSLKIGTKAFRIASVVVNEPDRLSGSFAAGPRVLISRQGLDETGLLAPGSHAGQRYLFKVPKPAKRRADLRPKRSPT